MTSFSIFIVEDEKFYGEYLKHYLSSNPDYEIRHFLTGKDFFDNLHKKPDVVTLDYSLPDMNGAAVLKKIRQLSPETQVIIVSGQKDILTALDLIKDGAYDYIVKDQDTRTRLWNVILRILENRTLKIQVEKLQEEVSTKYDFEKTIIGNSQAIKNIYALIEKASNTNINVSITGETGTGKEVVAKAIHYNSARRKKPFVAVNMSAIPRDLLESELFGYEKGAFTGANTRKTGKFEEATEGSLFLDEIGDMDLALQAKLLRVIQERELVRIGGKETISLDLRLIVATHRDLKEEVGKGNFRQDLFYRLLGLPIHLPPLRERATDILVLAKHFAVGFCKENNLPPIGFSSEGSEKLLRYTYPGNIRELKAIIDLAVVMSNGSILKPEDIIFSQTLQPTDFLNSGEMTLDEYNRMIIKSYLEKYKDDMVLVAEKLGIGKSTLYRMKQNNLI
ncbi:MAG: sigma-54 dependent transcriptional regulator [Bacteroidetes bacterium]|nr:sigma-54 dependent transcriptional regulator [Bacteroidota bacterium]